MDVNGAVETVHVKNTGRCKELLLLPGAAVRLEVSDNPKRKTKYDLVAVRKQELGWVNMDSQAPNKVVGEWLAAQGYDLVQPEFGTALAEAKAAGVSVLFLLCHVGRDSLEIVEQWEG